MFKKTFARVQQTGKGEDLEYSLPFTQGERWFLARVTPVRVSSSGKKSVCFLARDISERKRTENSLRLFRALLDRTNDAIEVLDPDTLRFLDCNHRACADLQYSRSEILSMTAYDIDPLLTFEMHAAVIQNLRQSGFLETESLHRRRDGSTFPIRLSVSLVRADKDYLVAIVRNITELKNAESTLRNLSGHLLSAQDNERRSVAREIHDEIGSYITGINLSLGRIRSFLDEANPEHQAALRECRGLISEAGDRVRTISYLLHPPALDELGLKFALKALVEGFAARSGIKTTLKVSASVERLGPAEELTLFRVAQESLNNVLRHSQSKTARVTLVQDTQRMLLKIADRGIGLRSDFRSNPNNFSVGILGMQERLREAGGVFDIRNGLDGGCVVQASIPLQSAGFANVGRLAKFIDHADG
jgi:PAS domain S-box-containing protein